MQRKDLMVDAVDYLLKPFEYDRFLKACYKANEYLEFLSTQELQLNSIFVKVNYEIMKINLKDIELIEALDDYIKIYIKPNPVLTLMTLKSIQEKLPARDFVRVHRSFIVPLAPHRKIQQNKIMDRRQRDPDRQQLQPGIRSVTRAF